MNHAKTTAVISSATVCINIVLNAVFIYGAFGIAPMGVRGAAMATLIARIIELTCSIAVSYRKGYIHPNMGQLFQRNKQLSQDFRKCALPLLGACLFWGIGFTSYSSFMGHLGVDAAGSQLCGCGCNGCDLLFQCRNLQCSRNHGRKRAGSRKSGKRKGLWYSFAEDFFVCGISVALLMCISAPVILHFGQIDAAGDGISERNVRSNCVLYDRTCSE